MSSKKKPVQSTSASPVSVSMDDAAQGINTDRPCHSLQQDLFDFQPTVDAIARTVLLAPANRGLVLHVDGEWGSGKSSALAFVKQRLREDGRRHSKPTLIDFNPWWFTDREDLAKQLLQQLAIELPRARPGLLKVGEMLSDYAAPLGGVVAGSLAAAGAVVPGADKASAAMLAKLKLPSKTLPQLKEEICDGLSKIKHRFVVFVDDVDRLSPTEVEQLFRVIKAVADFPNVIYVLAFDSTQVAQALEAQLKVQGRPYLEKIVQVPFVLPLPSRERIREELQTRLRAVAGHYLPDDRYSRSVLDAMAALIRRPRDLARLTNAYACTFPVVAGEVHAVDVAALDLMRTLALPVFAAIREHPQEFWSTFDFDVIGKDKSRRDAFHEGWGRGRSNKHALALDDLISLLFPRMQEGQDGYAPVDDDTAQLASAGRIASAWGHSVYFHLRPPAFALLHKRRDELLRITRADDLLKEWAVMLQHTDRSGRNQAGEFLLQVELCPLSAGFADAFLHSILRVDEDGLFRADRGQRLGHEVLTRPFLRCVDRLEGDRLAAVLSAIRGGTALFSTLRVALAYRHLAESGRPAKPAWLTPEAVDQVTRAAALRLEGAAQEGALLRSEHRRELVMTWWEFDKLKFDNWLKEVLRLAPSLVQFVGAFCAGDPSSFDVDSNLGFHGQLFEAVLPPDFGIASVEERLSAALQEPGTTASQARRLVELVRRYRSELLTSGAPTTPVSA